MPRHPSPRLPPGPSAHRTWGSTTGKTARPAGGGEARAGDPHGAWGLGRCKIPGPARRTEAPPAGGVRRGRGWLDADARARPVTGPGAGRARDPGVEGAILTGHGVPYPGKSRSGWVRWVRARGWSVWWGGGGIAFGIRSHTSAWCVPEAKAPCDEVGLTRRAGPLGARRCYGRPGRGRVGSVPLNNLQPRPPEAVHAGRGDPGQVQPCQRLERA